MVRKWAHAECSEIRGTTQDGEFRLTALQSTAMWLRRKIFRESENRYSSILKQRDIDLKKRCFTAKSMEL